MGKNRTDGMTFMRENSLYGHLDRVDEESREKSGKFHLPVVWTFESSLSSKQHIENH